VSAQEPAVQVFTLHAELEGMLLLDAFESLIGNGAPRARRSSGCHRCMRSSPSGACRSAP